MSDKPDLEVRYERLEKQVEQLMARVDKLEESMKAKGYQAGAIKLFLDKGREYAMMKTHGKYINEQGIVATPPKGTEETYLGVVQKQLLDLALKLLMEDALVGASNIH